MQFISVVRGAVLGAVCALAGCQVETTSQVAPDAAPEAPAPAAAKATRLAQGQVPPLTGRVATAGGTWNNNAANAVAFVGQAINVDGETVICGVRGAKGPGSRQFNGRLANGHSFVIGDQTVLRNIYFFTRARSIDTLSSTPATCKGTGVPWQASFATAPWALEYGGQTTFAR